MARVTRFDLALDAEEEDLLSRTASLTGMTMADFVRNAAKSKARILLEHESCVTLSKRDFLAFNAAINGAFAPNTALQEMLKAAGKSSGMNHLGFTATVVAIGRQKDAVAVHGCASTRSCVVSAPLTQRCRKLRYVLNGRF